MPYYEAHVDPPTYIVPDEFVESLRQYAAADIHVVITVWHLQTS